jgi:alginate O-acetyltransferase complex protein AlgJ
VEDDLNRGILFTRISPRLARAMTGLFLAAIFGVPVVQVTVELARGQEVQALTVFRQVPTKDKLHTYEKELEQGSVAKKVVQPQLQLALCSVLGFGNTSVIVGRDGWLFYRPGVDFLTGPGVLDEARLRMRTKELIDDDEKYPCPDPRPAIIAFHECCRRAGVHLVVLPVPDKATLQPRELTGRFVLGHPTSPPTNRDYARLLADLRAVGVDVFDPTPEQIVPGEEPRFLRQDTHWNPGWMETVAHQLADHVRRCVPMLSEPKRVFRVEDQPVSRVGDIVDMLELPAGQGVFPPQRVTIRRVVSADRAEAWQSEPNADVLLLGDSFSNIYCVPEMGWGQGAGLPAQLARFLGRDIDVIARNGSGASMTRRELLWRPNPLGGKRVVVWEFAVRDLALANWEVITIPEPGPADASRPAVLPAQPAVVDATVLAVSHVPQPYTVPYKDCLTYMKVRVDNVVQGRYATDQLIAVLWGMKDNRLLPAASYVPGKRLRLKITPLQQAPAELRAARSVDDLEDYDHIPYFALEEEGR